MFVSTISVVVDRKWDRSADVGRFELAYKQPLVTVPPYIGISLSVEGQSVRRPNWATRQSKDDSLFTPRPVAMRQTMVDRNITEMKKNSNHSSLAANSTGANQGSGETTSGKRDVSQSRTPDSSVKTRVKETKPKCSVDIAEKSKSANNKINVSANSNVEKSPIDPSTVAGNLRAKTTEHKKAETAEASTNTAPRLAESAGGLKVPNGSLSQPTRMLPNTPYLAGLNQKRFVSKTSVSTNYTIPLTSGNNSRTVAVNNVESTDLQTFKPAPKGNTTDHKFLAFPQNNRIKKKNKKKNKHSAILPCTDPESLSFHLPKVPYLNVSLDYPHDMSVPKIPSMPAKLKYCTRNNETLYAVSNYAVIGATNWL